jgi:hypothetical protein
MRTRTSYTKSSKIGAFFKRNWISVIVVLLLAVLVLPWVVYKIQDFVANLKANSKDNETKVIVNNVKNETVQNSATNTNSSTSSNAIEKKYYGIKAKYKNRIKPTDTKLWNSLKSDAHNLAYALGTHAKENQAWFGLDGLLGDRPDVGAFTEDEKEAIRILKKYPKTFDILAELYHTTATRSRDLRQDINKYIVKSDISILRKHYKNYKTSWL